MRRLISIVLTLMMLVSMVSVSLVATKAASEDRLPFSGTATSTEVLKKFAPYDGSSVKFYKLDGSGYVNYSALKESKFSSSYRYPYIIQGATAFGGAYYFAATYNNSEALKPNNYSNGYIVKYVVDEAKYYISDALPIGHGNDLCYNAEKNWILVANNSPNGQLITVIDPTTLTLIGQIDVGSDIGSVYAIEYNTRTDKYIICCSGTNTKNYIVTISDSLKLSVVKSYTRQDLNLDSSKSSYYLKQGLYATPDYLLYPYSGCKVGKTKNVMRVTDWEGNFIQDVTDPHMKELEDIMVDDDGYIYFVYHDNSARGAVYQVKMTAYTVKYLPNGGTGTMADSELYYGTQANLAKNQFTRPDHKFLGWYLTRKSDGKALYTNDGGTTKEWYTPGKQPSGYERALYADQQAVSALAHDLFDEVYCEAQWRECGVYTINFDGGNGAIGSMSSVEAECGEKITLPANSFTKSGWTFAGWKAPDGTIYSNKASVTDLAAKGESVTLTAQWQGYKYYISFNKNSGSGSMSKITTYAGIDVILPANKFTRSKYTFMGWTVKRGSDSTYLYESADGTSSGWYKADKHPSDWVKKVIADGATVTDLEAKSGKTATLYAEWEFTAGAYTINFNGGDGATGSMSSVKANRDTSVTLPANTFTKTGRTFAGWKAPDGTVYSNKASVKNLAPKNESVTLTAQWQGLKYYISFNKNSGSGSMSKITTYTGEKVTLPANKFTRSKYTFTGWTVKRGSDSTYLYESADGTSSGWYKADKQPSGWAKKVIADGATVIDLEAKSDKTATLYATWEKTAGTYTINFEGGDGATGSMSSFKADRDEAVKLPANTFTKTGRTFAGWKAPDGTVYSDKASVQNLAPKNGSVTLTAQWKGLKYYISFNKNSGSGSMSKITTYTGEKVTLPANKFTRSKYTFTGWTVKRGSDSTYLYESADGTSSGWYKADKQPSGWTKKVIADGATVIDLEAKSEKTATLYATWVKN